MDNQNPSNQIPPVEPQGQGIPPTSGTKLSTGIAIIVIAVLAAGAYFFFSNRTVTPKVEDANQTKNQEQPTDTQTADWQTYTNTKHGFEVKIPFCLNKQTAIWPLKNVPIHVQMFQGKKGLKIK
jgi:uncharacterized protein HemX